MQEQITTYLRDLQDRICNALADLDGKADDNPQMAPPIYWLRAVTGLMIVPARGSLRCFSAEPWQRSQVILSAEKTGDRYRFDVPKICNAVPEWQKRHPSATGRVKSGLGNPSYPGAKS